MKLLSNFAMGDDDFKRLSKRESCYTRSESAPTLRAFSLRPLYGDQEIGTPKVWQQS